LFLENIDFDENHIFVLYYLYINDEYEKENKESSFLKSLFYKYLYINQSEVELINIKNL
jgi:hypothetical protein